MMSGSVRQLSYENAAFDPQDPNVNTEVTRESNGTYKPKTSLVPQEPNQNTQKEERIDDVESLTFTKDSHGGGSILSCLSPKANRIIKWCLAFAAVVVYHVYLGFGILLSWQGTKTYCDSVKLLVIITAVTYFFIAYSYLKKYINPVFENIYNAIDKLLEKHRFWWKRITWTLVWFAVLGFLIADSLSNNAYRLVSLGGMVTLLLLGVIVSKHRRHIAWGQVMWGVLLQFIMGLLVLRWDTGQEIVGCLSGKVEKFLGYTNEGSKMVFGYLVGGTINITNETIIYQGPIFAFQTMPVVIFFSFCVSILYYYGIMQIMVIKVGWLLRISMGTTACESVSAAGNIFLGQTEAPLMVRPYLPTMTKSELHSVMTGGFATIAGSVMAAFISFGIDSSHLLTASVMSAPAALAFSKLVYPETEESKTRIDDIEIKRGEETTVLEAAGNGTTVAVKLVANIIANLIAFVAFIHFLNQILNYFGSIVTWDFLSFEWILGKVFTPLAFVMGVNWNDCEKVGELIGLKTLINEFVAYDKLSKLKLEKVMAPRSEVLATYALCGFSNFSSIGIMLGGLGSMAPSRKGDLSDMAFRALFAGSCACFMTACVAGVLVN